MSISERIFYYMKCKNMTQAKFSELTGISQSTICDWKRKNNTPSVEKLPVICETLNITYSQLINGEGSKVSSGDISETEFSNLEKKLIADFRTIKREDKKRLLIYLSNLKKLNEMDKA